MNASFGTMIGSYLEGVDLLKSAVAGMFPEHLVAHPVPGKWSTMEVVCHLADFEPIFAERMKRIIAMERPLMLGSDHEVYVSQLAYAERDLAEELVVVEAVRKQMARILRALPAEAMKRQGVHADRGLITLENVLASAINHIPHHVGFIQEKRRALGLPTS